MGKATGSLSTSLIMEILALIQTTTLPMSNPSRGALSEGLEIMRLPKFLPVNESDGRWAHAVLSNECAQFHSCFAIG